MEWSDVRVSVPAAARAGTVTPFTCETVFLVTTGHFLTLREMKKQSQRWDQLITTFTSWSWC